MYDGVGKDSGERGPGDSSKCRQGSPTLICKSRVQPLAHGRTFWDSSHPLLGKFLLSLRYLGIMLGTKFIVRSTVASSLGLKARFLRIQWREANVVRNVMGEAPQE